MASSLPSPVAAALGVVPAVLDGVRRLPGKAVQLPILAISGALTSLDTLRREYDALVVRGEELVGRWSGEAGQLAGDLAGDISQRADEIEDRVERLVERTPFAGAYDRAEDTLEDLAGQARGAAGQAAQRVAGAAEQTADVLDATAGRLGATAEQVTAEVPSGFAPTPEAEAPKGAPTPKEVRPDSTRVDTAASPSIVQAVDQAVAETGAGAPVDHDELPLPDYDHMTLGSLRGRLRALSVAQLVTIRAYERSHADRLPVVTMLDNRIAKLASDADASPSGPVSTEPAPEQRSTPQPTGQDAGAVSPATTNAPVINPPSHGDPTNPSSPRR